ncbi:Carnitine O-acetyltransferase, mitochondrial [Sparassis crispa]|uniref:Carnitine O-acetyltransferase, mitochondrial n=1 Tax=Sparassis crispa TaxID=139825 RepID=A0A401H5C1_9APHY|nr:Carnitine O-acetyltransferase, mitochondrial [Sparassis crispa]GBE89636.1 Carnitine O-acetyltransferase, mitochondrial [Sparassis crispa]
MSSRTRPANWKFLAPPPLPGPTFAAQSTLPSLPVPTLTHTLHALKASLRPIAWDEQEYAAALRKIDEFATGPAEELQNRLETRQKETIHWLEDWWDDGGYLMYRDSIVVNVSYYYGFKEHPPHLPQTSVHRAASLVRAGMLFRQQVKLGQVPPDAVKEGPLCMDTWRWMFDCSRVPGPGADWSVSYALPGERGDSGHVVVLRRGRVWRLEPWRNGQLLSLAALQKQIQHIYDNTTAEYPGVGILTASNRDVWNNDYNELAADPHNAEVLKTIHGAAFVVCLDSEPYPSFMDHSRSLWHGAVTPQADAPGGALLGLRNRWMDKPCQFIVSEDGKAGLLGEHSVMDGTPTVTLCDRVLDIIAAPDFVQQSGAKDGALPTALDWNVSPATQTAIGEAARAARELIESQAMGIIRTSYGKAAIKAFGVSPDSWTQLIIQLAYARLLRARGERRQGGTYEAATTRRFFKGRTEAIRVVSAASDAWVASMDDPKVSVSEKGELFAHAVKVHGSWARMAGKAHGIDRHLLGLKKVLKEGEPTPEMFTDPVFLRSSNWVLSTSAIFSKHFGPYGWGEVVANGFGVAYLTGFDDYLQFTITSRTEMPNAEFCTEVERAANDLYQLHQALAAEKASHVPKAKM